MYLTREENEMLEGKRGYPVQKAMEILVGLGECYDAERLIPVSSAHMLYNSTSMGKGGIMFFQEMVDQGARCVIDTTTNPVSFQPEIAEQFGMPPHLMQDQAQVCAIFERMGVLRSSTCTPYLVGSVPRLREHVSWNESSAISFANSVCGARTNREGGPSAFAAAMTGRVPEYGLHLDSNRAGQIKIVVTARLDNVHDYGTLGYYTGSVAQDRVPVFTGIPPSVSWNELKTLGAACAVSGSVALYHVVGVTPEAPDEPTALGGGKCPDSDTFEFGAREMKETRESLNNPAGGKVDLVALGCPHVSITELREVASLLAGKKLRAGVELWVGAAHMVRAYGEVMGYVKTIEESGARVLAGACPMVMVREVVKDGRPRVIATDSPKLANGVGVYDATGGKITMYYRPPVTCVRMATGEEA